MTPERRFFWLCAVYIVVAGILTPLEVVYWRESLGLLAQWHQSMLAGSAFTPNQFRVLSFLLPEAIHRMLGFSLVFSYLAQRFLVLALLLCLLHRYLRQWLDDAQAMAGTLLFAAIQPVTGMDMIQPAEPLNVLLFILGFWAIHRGRLLPLAAVLVLGTLNKESIAFLVPCYLLFNWGRKPRQTLLMETAMLTALFAVVWSVVRLYYNQLYGVPLGIYEPQFDYNMQILLIPAFVEAWNVLRHGNLWVARPYLALWLYGVLWVLPFLRFREKPLFFRRLMPIIPVFLLAHLFVGRFDETRLFLPLFPLLIPMGFLTLFRSGEVGEN